MACAAGSWEDCPQGQSSVPGCFGNQRGSNAKEFKTRERIKAGNLGLQVCARHFHI